jgi:hypothetical protein
MLYCLARQMIDLGRYAEALDLAQTGTYAIRRSATPKAMAMLLIIQARAYAGMGRASECSYALGIAQDAFSQAGPGTDPEWCAFFDEGELYGLLGVALRDLALASEGYAERYATDARPWIERAIERRPSHFLRSRVMDMDSLAVVNVLLKEPESAIETARTAIFMAGRVASSRVISRLRRTGRLAQAQFPRLSAIADLADQTRAIAVRPTDQRG